ncbi:hypothetical protein KQI42_19450 [Tissierella sp. MSJ-40]|uniref:Sporulation protein Cse60 n=1 Tax=Tissierella simiarum TaxID=2841534 RepID=A0ABS6EB64_9FIRM|nr:hypothetical protein [Tissierella simiarum]MBU5440173.1 hypothetical protein [Tissierella simiarum]
MKHEAFVQYNDGSELKDKVESWIAENEDKILEVIDIEYEQHGNIYVATITYRER